VESFLVAVMKQPLLTKVVNLDHYSLLLVR
jgi:hypothetical protein